jgi:hypothetical protein
MGTAELQGMSVESKMLEVEQASLNSEAQARLSEIRSKLGIAEAQAPAAAPAEATATATAASAVAGDAAATPAASPEPTGNSAEES